jgi:predicted phosphodiesterase
MRYLYKGFISQNIAPQGSKRIGVYDADGNRVCGIPLGVLSMPDVGHKLYSYGLISDLHCGGNHSPEKTNLDHALTHFENQGCSFCCHCGDMTNIGFWYPPADAAGANINPDVIYLKQFEEYKSVIDAHPNLPVYGVCGNHDSYTKPVTENLAELKEYTGLDLYDTVNHDKDVFIFLGQHMSNRPMSEEALQWLYETLEANRNKRCFVFVHPYVDNSDSGNPYGVYGNHLFAAWGENTTVFKNLLNHYKNTFLCHGHSHMHFLMQEEVSNSNYSEVLGFRSLHVPSISWNRKIVNGASVKTETCFGYVVDVYENCVVLKGYDFYQSQWVPIAQYCIDTTLQPIEAGTFRDTTGTMITGGSADD